MSLRGASANADPSLSLGTSFAISRMSFLINYRHYFNMPIFFRS